MRTKEENRKITLENMIDEKFAEIYFLAKEEYDIESKSLEERRLYELLDGFKHSLKEKCEEHFVQNKL